MQFIISVLGTSENKLVCSHPVFCNLTILARVQAFFNDSKDFVDSALSKPLADVLSDLQSFQNLDVKLKQNFLPPESILKDAVPSDYSQSPQFLNSLSGKQRQIAEVLNKKWLLLSKKYQLTTGGCKNNCTSVPDQFADRLFIFPGGRFREGYYWDSFWIIKGLLVCDMYRTAIQVVQNFFLQIQALGHVSNGFRVYYQNRSQPPLLSQMVKAIADYLKPVNQSLRGQFIRKAYDMLKREHSFWLNQRTRNVTVKGRFFQMAFYSSSSSQARPQSFLHDEKLAENLTGLQRDYFFRNINAAAQSGWDFSTRWFANSNDIQSIRTQQIIPSDLNFYLTMAEDYLSELAIEVGFKEESNTFKARAASRRSYFRMIQSQQGFNDLNGSATFSMSSLFPYLLFQQDNKTISKFNLLEKFKVLPPVTLSESNQQWDKPNVWAPVVYYLSQLDIEKRQVYMDRWLTTVYCGWKKYGQFLQKYSSDVFGQKGKGGEYIIQEGFGWTNGLSLEYLKRGGRVQSCSPGDKETSDNQIMK